MLIKAKTCLVCSYEFKAYQFIVPIYTVSYETEKQTTTNDPLYFVHTFCLSDLAKTDS